MAWHAHCYHTCERDPFPIGLTPLERDDCDREAPDQVDEGWELTQAEREDLEAQFYSARPGDHLMCPFQCDQCHFRNMLGRDPMDDHIDRWLLLCIRRANLDAFWARRPSTVLGNLREAQRAMKIASQLRIPSPVSTFLRGPFPLSDTFGMGMAITLLQRSLDPGRNSATVQWDTVRGLTSFYTNYIHTTQAGIGVAALTDGKSKTYFSSSPTHASPWYARFRVGCHERMGDVRIPDKALSIDILLALQDVLEEHWTQAKTVGDNETQFEVATLGTALTSSFSTSLRGEELGHARLRDTRILTEQGVSHPRKPHVVLGLQGRFKGTIGRKKHRMPLAPTTASGISNQRWLLRLLASYEKGSIFQGPLFRSFIEGARPATVKELDVLLHRFLLLVQERRVDLIPATVDVTRDYSMRRSPRRGSTSQARNRKVPEDIINLINRWRKEERARHRDATHVMMEHYTDVIVAVEALLQYSEAL